MRSLQVLRVFGYGLLIGVLLLSPAFPATSLVSERVRGTLALLLNSPLSATSIYCGKLLASLGFTAILLLMTIPAAGACHALGGVSERGGVVMLYAVLMMTAVQIATLGLLVSSRAQTLDGALRTTYALVLAIALLPLVPFWLTQGSAGAEIADWVRCLSPIPAVMEVLGQSGIGSRGMGVNSAILRYLLLSGIVGLGCAAATVWALETRPLDRGRPAGVMTQDRSTIGRWLRRLIFLVDPQRRSRGTSLLLNPVMVKEFRTRRFGRSHWTLRLIALTAVLSLALSYLAAGGALGWGIEETGGALVLLQTALLILFAPSLAAGLISSEREGRTWTLLRTTPLSSGRILRGKLFERGLATFTSAVRHPAGLHRPDDHPAGTAKSDRPSHRLPGRDGPVLRAGQHRGEQLLSLDCLGHGGVVSHHHRGMPLPAVDLAGSGSTLWPLHGRGRLDDQPPGRGAQCLGDSRLRELSTTPDELVADGFDRSRSPRPFVVPNSSVVSARIMGCMRI